jgi:hypothetical protein
MTNRTRRIRATLVGIVVAALAVVAPATLAAPADAATHPRPAAPVRDICPAVPAGQARCLAEFRTDVHGGKGLRGQAARSAAQAALPAGYGPADLRSAYALPTDGGANQTVAIVDAGDDPNAEADLDVYRATYGLPPCTTANGCFRKVNQEGQATPPPAPLPGWPGEISLDVDMVSAACQDCRILLVVTDDNSNASLAAGVNTAVSLGATEVSNSYGGEENGGTVALASAYDHPGVAITASSGDQAYGIPNVPAAYSTVIAVGGTSLTKANNARGWTEQAWDGASSGCSAWIAKPAWQQDPNCPGRMVADVSADADPATPLALYDSFDEDGWIVTGGTSASSPFIAAVIGLAGNPGRYSDASYFYSHANELNDVVGGSNAVFGGCGGDYQCDAVVGYDGPTGLGTPNGLAAF